MNGGINTSFDSWCEQWNALSGKLPPETVYHALIAAYSEPHRAYHTMQHLQECFSFLDEAPESLRVPEISLALWFHDSIYDTTRSDNEARSADWLGSVAESTGTPPEVTGRLRALVMATRHAALPDSPDAQFLVDVDLSILAARTERFDEYEAQIRREYSWVAETDYREKRSRLLQKFLSRPNIYLTANFHARFEQSARQNIRRSLLSLE